MPRARTESSELLSRADQIAVATMVAAAVVALLAYWIKVGGDRGRLIHIEHAEPREFAFRVDINEAPWPELAQLPDVGEMLAKRIVAYRTAHGPFRSHADLDRVNGIGPRTLETICPYLLPFP